MKTKSTSLEVILRGVLFIILRGGVVMSWLYLLLNCPSGGGEVRYL
jgi:hypothetical protein